MFSTFALHVTAFTYSAGAIASISFAPTLPPSYPLAVRNPYLSAWLPGNQAANISSAVPEFWNGQQMTWSVMARVDDQTYSLFGVPRPGSGVATGELLSASYTSTRTTFVVSTGKVSFALDFLSPISPHDLVRQSMPFSYLTVSASILDGSSPNVQIYSDMDNSWIGQFGYEVALRWEWSVSNGDIQIFTFIPDDVAQFSESGDMALWGTAAYCTRTVSSMLTAMLGYTDDVRASFVTKGSLEGNWEFNPGSVFAYSHDLGEIHDTTNVTFVVGHVREPALNYLGGDRVDYYRSTCSDINCGCVKMLEDFEDAEAEARALDTFVSNAAANVAGSKYSDILALSARQAFGSMDLTIPSESLDIRDVLLFVKEISSDGNINTIDVLMPMAPIFYVLAPGYLRLTLEPVMRYLQSGAWPHEYTIHDIGSNYPNATGHNDGKAEPMPVEECGNLLALVYMYELATGDTSWKQPYMGVLQSYADYLVLNGLYPAEQLSTDDGAGNATNQTGLAVKAAIALNAFGVMSGQSNYSDAGKQFAKILYDDAAGTDSNRTHFTLLQGDGATWSLQFNLYLDVLLKLQTFPAEVLKMQTTYYGSVREDQGVPLDSRERWSKTDWMIFAAATAMAEGVGDEKARDMFINDVHALMTSGKNSVPFSDKYFVQTKEHSEVGRYDGYKNRPVVGGHFALLALEGADQWKGSSTGKAKRQAATHASHIRGQLRRSGSYPSKLE